MYIKIEKDTRGQISILTSFVFGIFLAEIQLRRQYDMLNEQTFTYLNFECPDLINFT